MSSPGDLRGTADAARAAAPFKVVLIVNSVLGKTYGLNIIAAQLRKLGADVRVLYLADISVSSVYSQSVMSVPNTPGCPEFSEPVISQVVDLCRGASLVGLSLLTSGYFNAVQMTRRLKDVRPDVPVIWGGKHPTINPTECLEHADVVCVGEGDLAMAEYTSALMAGRPPGVIPGLWFREAPAGTAASYYCQDLDNLPFPDYGPEGHYALEDERVRAITAVDIDRFLLKEYPTMIARGCPMRCTFCTNSAEDNRRLRIRSAANVIAELTEAQRRYGPIRRVMFRDDTILSLKADYLREFASLWRRGLRLPFSSSGVIPTAVRADKLQLLLDVGFSSVKMGIQSGSLRVRREIYWRPETDEQVLRAADILHGSKTPHVGYMFITDNPWESEEDTVTSLRFIPRLPRPFSLSMYSLNLYPGTELFNQALRENRIANPRAWYNKSTMTLSKTYFNMLFMMQRYYAVPLWLMKLLTSRALYRNAAYRNLFTAAYGWYFRNLTAYGVERKPVRPKTVLHKGAELFIDVFFRFEFRQAGDKILRKFRMRPA